jgi:hypothetical protein
MDGNMKQIEIDFEYLNLLGSLLGKVTFSGGMGNFIKCTVAGGAIRDMLLQKPVSDIDVFYVGDIKTAALLNYFKEAKATNQSYPDGFTVTHTVALGGLPVPIQLIQVKDIEKHIETFPTPMSRVQYSHANGLSGVDLDFTHNVVQKEFVWDSKVDMPYYDKIKDKYSDWKHVFLNEGDNPYHEVEELF